MAGDEPAAESAHDRAANIGCRHTSDTTVLAKLFGNIGDEYHHDAWYGQTLEKPQRYQGIEVGDNGYQRGGQRHGEHGKADDASPAERVRQHAHDGRNQPDCQHGDTNRETRLHRIGVEIRHYHGQDGLDGVDVQERKETNEPDDGLGCLDAVAKEIQAQFGNGHAEILVTLVPTAAPAGFTLT